MKALLVTLLVFITVSAIIAGALMILDPSGELLGLPLSALESVLFNSFFLPGILLLLFIGGPGTLAIIYLSQNNRKGYSWAIISGVITCLWICGQLIFFHQNSWLQPSVFVGGLSEILLAYQLKGKWVV